MKLTHNRQFSLFVTIVLLIALTACAKSSSKEEESEAESSSQIEEAQTAEETAAEQDELANGTTARQAQLSNVTTADQAQPIEDAMQLLQQANEAAQEKYDNLDLNEKESVVEMIRALEKVISAIYLVRDQKIAVWDSDGKTLSIGQEILCVCVGDGEFPTFIDYMKGRKGLVITHYGGDNYVRLYVCDGTLIGKESGHSSGRLDFFGCLPDWKDDPAGETHSIIDGREIQDDNGGSQYDKEAEYVAKYLQEAEEVLREAGK